MRAQTESRDRAGRRDLLHDRRARRPDAGRPRLRRARRASAGKPAVLIANKSEGSAGEAGRLEAYALGLGEPVAISAEHNEGMADLYDALRAALPERDRRAGGTGGQRPKGAHPIRVAIVGRPNAGKSTLINRLIGEERLLTGPEAGITRDAIAVEHDWQGRTLPHLRHRRPAPPRARRGEAGEALGRRRAQRRALRRGGGGAGRRRASPSRSRTSASPIWSSAKAARWCSPVGKWDLQEKKAGAIKKLRDQAAAEAHAIEGRAAGGGVGADRRGPRPADAGDRRCLRGLEQARADRGAQSLVRAGAGGASAAGGVGPPAQAQLHHAGQERGRRASCCSARAPTRVPDAYKRYLVNSLRETFDLPGTPIRLTLREKENPFKGRAKRRH